MRYVNHKYFFSITVGLLFLLDVLYIGLVEDKNSLSNFFSVRLVFNDKKKTKRKSRIKFETIQSELPSCRRKESVNTRVWLANKYVCKKQSRIELFFSSSLFPRIGILPVRLTITRCCHIIKISKPIEMLTFYFFVKVVVI